jgi:putative addiction module component (TIGR02574 family)
MSIAEIQNMSTVERLRVMEALWDSFASDAQELASPAWHGEILDHRQRRIQSGEAQFVSMDEARNRLLG